MPLVPKSWDIDRDRARFLLALCKVVPEAHDYLRKMCLRLYTTGKGDDGRAVHVLARRWARRFRLLEAANPRLPAAWAIDVAFFNLMRWYKEMEDPGEEDEDVLRQCMGASALEGTPVPEAADFTFVVPWYTANKNEERLVTWEDVPIPDLCFTSEWYPQETRRQARARILAEFKTYLDSWLDRYERCARQHGWHKQRQNRRPRQREKSSPDHPTRHHEWLALYLAARLRWAEIAELYTSHDLENPVEADTVRKAAARLAGRIGLYVPLGHRNRE